MSHPTIRPATISGASRVRRVLTPADPALGRAQRHVEEGRDLLVREVLEEGEAQRLALRHRQGVHGRPHRVAAMLATTSSSGPGPGIGPGVRRPPADCDVVRGLRLRRRCSLMTRVRVICKTQVRNVPRAGSKVAACCQTARKTSWLISSPDSGPRDRAASPRISDA